MLQDRWLIHHESLMSYLPLVVHWLNGGKLDFSAEAIATTFHAHEPGADTTAVIPVSGILYAWKSNMITEAIEAANQDPTVKGVILHTNTPGGQVTGIDRLSKAVANSQKPIVAYVEGLAASAGMWAISGADRIIVSSPLDRLGSIGVMLSYMDFDKALRDKLGVGIHEVYATKSTRKNEELRELLSGNQEPLVKDLDFVNEYFHNAIRENMGVTDEEVFTGATFNAVEGISKGLAHQLGSLTDAVDFIEKQATVNRIRQFNY
jgi:capsid assembly protease